MVQNLDYRTLKHLVIVCLNCLLLKSIECIARIFYCTLVGQRIVMLHSFVKKSQKTPLRELRIAEIRMKEIKHADTR